jgi:hypothetical protein
MSGGKGGGASAGYGIDDLSAAIDAFLGRETIGRNRVELLTELIALRYAIDRLKRVCSEMAKDV